MAKQKNGNKQGGDKSRDAKQGKGASVKPSVVETRAAEPKGSEKYGRGGTLPPKDKSKK